MYWIYPVKLLHENFAPFSTISPWCCWLALFPAPVVPATLSTLWVLFLLSGGITMCFELNLCIILSHCVCTDNVRMFSPHGFVYQQIFICLFGDAPSPVGTRSLCHDALSLLDQSATRSSVERHALIWFLLIVILQQAALAAVSLANFYVFIDRNYQKLSSPVQINCLKRCTMLFCNESYNFWPHLSSRTVDKGEKFKTTHRKPTENNNFKDLTDTAAQYGVVVYSVFQQNLGQINRFESENNLFYVYTYILRLIRS